MCGIAGYIDFENGSSEKILRSMTNTLAHRGPDGKGYKVVLTPNAQIGLGHRRLSIIDLSENGSQPMTKEHLSIVFNGEIYNYEEIKRELLLCGHSFESTSDTEVILASYLEWGISCLEKFRGMFAISLLDTKNKCVFLIRDRIGVKPLYVFEKNGCILYGSELKALHKHPKFDASVDMSAVALYFKYGFVPSPKSIFENTSKLSPGHYLKIDLDQKNSSLNRYWNPTDYISHSKEYPEGIELEDEIEKLLAESFNYRMVSDVPVGVFLSGGYDSSLVTAILQKNKSERINTFTIGFENEKFNEADYAAKVANYLGTNHTSYTCTTKEAQDIIPQLPYYYDEPLGDSSAIPTFLVSKITSQSVKVALSADGGDELFGGYSRNLRFLNIHRRVSSVPRISRKFLELTASLMEKAQAGNIDRSIWWSKARSIISDTSLLSVFDTYPQFFSDNFTNNILGSSDYWNGNPQNLIRSELKEFEDKFNALLSFDYQSTLTNDMLVKVDRATMAHSLEGREPLLDHKIYEFVSGIPSTVKLKENNLKYLLKNITHRYIPKSIMQRPKMGFGIPIKDWLLNDLNHLIQDHFQESEINKYGILDSRETIKMVTKLQEKDSNSNLLWILLNFQMWCKQWL